VVRGLILDNKTLRVLLSGSSKLNPQVIGKTYPRPIFAFVKVVDGDVRE
jgi:hypothetical protein